MEIIYEALVAIYLAIGVVLGTMTKINNKEYKMATLFFVQFGMVLFWLPIILFGGLYNLYKGYNFLGDDK